MTTNPTNTSPFAEQTELLFGLRVGDFPAFHVDPVELNDLVEEKGVGCEYRRAVWCPCVRVETGRARTGCPHCDGLRFTYPESLRCDTVVMIVNRNPKREKAPPGEMVTGTAVLTFPLGLIPGEGDVVIPDNEYHTVNEHVWRKHQQIDNNVVRSRAVRAGDEKPKKISPYPETLLYPKIRCIDHIHWVDEDTNLRSASAADYVLKGNEVVWHDNRGPEPGTPYTVRYQAQAAFILNPSEPLYRAENGGTGFPYRADGMRLDRWSKYPSLRGDK